jgi:transposase
MVALIVAEIDEIARFDSHEELVSYAGPDLQVHQSGETEVHGSISKEGSAPLRWALVLMCAAHSIKQTLKP